MNNVFDTLLLSTPFIKMSLWFRFRIQYSNGIYTKTLPTFKQFYSYTLFSLWRDDDDHHHRPQLITITLMLLLVIALQLCIIIIWRNLKRKEPAVSSARLSPLEKCCKWKMNEFHNVMCNMSCVIGICGECFCKRKNLRYSIRYATHIIGHTQS